MGQRKSKSKVGDKFGKLTIIANPFIHVQGRTSRYFAKTQCDCGNQQVIPCSKLRTGAVIQCKDCSFRDRSLNAPQVTQLEQMFKRLVLDRCKKYNILVSLTLDAYQRLVTSNCFYCGAPPTMTSRFQNRKYVNNAPVIANGVDRIDSSKGYTPDNCVTCCTSCNYAKHSLTQPEFFKKIIQIYNHLNL